MGKIVFEERVEISKLAAAKMGVRAIANRLDRSPSSISTEVRRQGMNLSNYDPIKAQENADLRKGVSRRVHKIQGALKECIELLLLEKRFSPQQICAHLKKQHPERTSLHLCHETIYRYIYQSNLKDIYAQCLRRRRRKRKSPTKTRRQGIVRNYTSISQRPREIENREEPGHWESDLIVGKNNQSAIGTLVERTTRYTIIVHLPEGKKSAAVVQNFHESLLLMPDQFKKSLTHDQGSELAHHQKLATLSGMAIFFAHKGSPWERGTNENTNGLIRDFFPKSTDFSKISEAELKKVEILMNERPRKVLNYKTPKEALIWLSENPATVLSDFVN